MTVFYILIKLIRRAVTMCTCIFARDYEIAVHKIYKIYQSVCKLKYAYANLHKTIVIKTP